MSTSTTNKYRVRELAKDFGLPNKDVIEILGKYGEAPKSNMQALSDGDLSLVFESLTQSHPASSMQEIFADTYQEPKKAEQSAASAAQPQKAAAPAAQAASPAAPTAQQPHKTGAPAPHAAPVGQPQQRPQQPFGGQAKPALAQPSTRVPQKKVVDTRKGGDVNLAKYDEKLEQMAPEKARRMQAPAGNKQKFRPNNNRRPAPA